MALQERFNNENILSRAVIAGLLNILNNKIVYEQVWANDDIEEIKLPWFYNMSGDERFLQDFYTFYGHCLPPKPIDGNFDMIPRGIITYTGSIIDSVRTTSRFIQGTYLKDVNGQLQTYRSFLYSIPLNMNFDCELWLDNQVTSLKVEQILREVFYKTITFYVYFKGMRVGCSVGFPEDYTVQKNIQYSFETANTTQIKLNFVLQVETYQPVFDPTTEINANEYMTGVGLRLWTGNEKNDGQIVITTPDGSTLFPKGYPLLIEWDYVNEAAIINKIDVYWSNAGETSKTKIEQRVPNHEYYIWNVPVNFTTYKQPAILWNPDSSISVYRNPIIGILPDTSTLKIDASSFTIIDSGYFLLPELDASLYAVLEMRDSNNRVVYSGDASLYFNIEGNKINETTPVVLPYGPIIFPNSVNYKIIDIHIANSVNTDVIGTIQNIKIV